MAAEKDGFLTAPENISFLYKLVHTYAWNSLDAI